MFLPLITSVLLAQSVSVSAAAAPRVEQFRYRFDNPSTFESAERVPHFFEQKYDVVPLWFSVEARYRAGGTHAVTNAAVSLRATTHGSDIDTFMLPSGDIATSGTDGDVRLQSWALGQRFAVAERRGWQVGVTFDYRHDAAEFLPDDRIVTHTNPASTTRTFITDREFTTSQVFAIGADIERVHSRSGGWQFRFGAGIQPVVAARLLVQLPDKYTGVDLTYGAISAGATAHWSLEREAGPLRLGIAMQATGARGYRRSPAYSSRGVNVTIYAGTRGR